MKKIKILFQQSMIISTGILFAIAVEGIVCHLMGQDILFAWYHPISIILAGFLCALPTLVWLSEEELTKMQFIIRIILHCILLFGIVSLMGYLFHWYENLWEYLFVVLAYFVIYIFVWLVSIWLWKWEENKINRALESIRDKE